MRRSNRVAHAALRMFAVLAAGLATHACGDDSVFTTYGSFNVHSVGSGELSSESFRVDVITGGVLQVKYLAPRLHCSSVKIHFLVDGAEKALSGAIAPGASSGYFDLGPVPAGRHEVAVRAEGVPGGCNSGRLMSWQGSITVWTSPPGTSVQPPGDHLDSAIFDADFVNYAWGYVNRGCYVTADGGIYAYRYDRGSVPWIPRLDAQGRYAKADLLKKLITTASRLATFLRRSFPET
jgi:hypothetical protein